MGIKVRPAKLDRENTRRREEQGEATIIIIAGGVVAGFFIAFSLTNRNDTNTIDETNRSGTPVHNYPLLR